MRQWTSAHLCASDTGNHRWLCRKVGMDPNRDINVFHCPTVALGLCKSQPLAQYTSTIRSQSRTLSLTTRSWSAAPYVLPQLIFDARTLVLVATATYKTIRHGSTTSSVALILHAAAPCNSRECLPVLLLLSKVQQVLHLLLNRLEYSRCGCQCAGQGIWQ